MKTLGLYSGHNLPFFKTFELDLDYTGVTVIRGLNLNVKGMKDRNNGSGKTLFLSGIAEILISSNPTIERNEVIARKALFPNPDSQITIQLDSTMLTKGRFGGAAVSYGIESDNGGLEKVKRDVSQTYLAENIGYNEDAFYSLVYLDGGKDFPLIVGSAVQRIQFLSNIFNRIDAFDQLLQYFTAKTREFGQKAQTFYTLEDELYEIRGEDGDEETPTVEFTQDDVDELDNEIAKLKTRLSAARKQLSNSEMASTYLTLTKNIDSISKKLGIDRDRAEREFDCEGARRKVFREYNTAKSEYNSLKLVLEELEEKIAELEDKDLDDSKYDLIENADAYADTYKAWGDFIQGEINNITIALSLMFRVKVPQTLDDLLDLHTIVEFLMLTLMPAGSVIGKQSATKSPFALASNLPEVRRLEYVSALGKVRTRIQTLLDKKIAIGSLGESLSEKEIKKIKRARKNKMDLEDLRDEEKAVQRKFDNVKDRLKGIEKPKLMDLKDYDLLGEMVRDIKTLASLGMKKVGETISESKLEKIRAEVDKLEETIISKTAECTEIKSQIKFLEENESVIESIEKKMGKLEKYTKATPIAEALKRAFGNKGIRVTLLNQLANLLALRMNRYAHLVFPEPMVFKFELSDKSCEIIVTRNPGTKNEVTSDVRVLSQGERKSFSLLLMYSLLPLTPINNRFNVVILDEMTANMDAPTKLKVFRDFIPALREVVPHVILADTGNLEIDDAREYTIVKKGNVSKLVENENVYQEVNAKV